MTHRDVVWPAEVYTPFKRHRLDAALMCGIVLPAIGVALCSAIVGEQVSVLLLAMLMLVPATFCSSLLIGYRRHTRRAVLPVLIAPVVAFVLLISVPVTHWPLRVTYALSREAFDALALRVRSGEQIPTPVRIGLFTIRKAELAHHGIVCLWTDLEPSGKTGFVQTRRDHVPFNLWSMVNLDSRWQLISED